MVRLVSLFAIAIATCLGQPSVISTRRVTIDETVVTAIRESNQLKVELRRADQAPDSRPLTRDQQTVEGEVDAGRMFAQSVRLWIDWNQELAEPVDAQGCQDIVQHACERALTDHDCSGVGAQLCERYLR